MTAPLAPPSSSARAAPFGKLPFGFGPRFFWALAIGLIWVVPAFWTPRLIAALFAWDFLALALWLIDLYRLPRPSDLEVTRSWTAPLSVGRHADTHLALQSSSPVALEITAVDETPPALRSLSGGGAPPTLTLSLPPHATARGTYPITPRERGDAQYGSTFLRYQSNWRFAERRAFAPTGQTIRILPDLVFARETSLYLIRSRQVELEKRRRRQPGIGREFESLREHRDGDEFRDISWLATARRSRLVTRTYEAERSQTVWLVLDAGRLMRARIEPAHHPDSPDAPALTKLDHAVNAALALAQVIAQSGDRVGLLCYGRAIQSVVKPGVGHAQIRAIIEALANVRAEPVEADHAAAAGMLMRLQTRRALVLWITDFPETPATPDVIEYAARVSYKHLVVFAAVSQPDLAALAHSVPSDEAGMFRFAAALEIQDRRELLLRRLRTGGVLTLELSTGRLATALVNQYLEIKDRNLI